MRGGAQRARHPQVLAFCRHDWAPSQPAPQPLPNWEDEPWEVRRDAYGSRVLVPRSQCADDAEEDDFDDDDAAYDDADDANTYTVCRGCSDGADAGVVQR